MCGRGCVQVLVGHSGVCRCEDVLRLDVCQGLKVVVFPGLTTRACTAPGLCWCIRGCLVLHGQLASPWALP
jgi:hypothetical protein